MGVFPGSSVACMSASFRFSLSQSFSTLLPLFHALQTLSVLLLHTKLFPPSLPLLTLAFTYSGIFFVLSLCFQSAVELIEASKTLPTHASLFSLPHFVLPSVLPFPRPSFSPLTVSISTFRPLPLASHSLPPFSLSQSHSAFTRHSFTLFFPSLFL